MGFDDLQRPVSGLAHALDRPSPSLAQNSATTRLEPQKAITILLDQHDKIIFAYLRLARSLSPSLHYFPGHGSLSSDQVLAVGALRDYADDKIRTWLEQARKLSSDTEQRNCPRGIIGQESGFAYSYLPSSGHLQGTAHAPGGSASVRAPPNGVQIEGSHQITPNTSDLHQHQTFDKTDTSRKATKAVNLYWCTICEVRRPYKNLSDWKKHEKEHVDTYVCMLGAPLEKTEGGTKCILCGLSNPSEKHLGAHKIQICGQGVPGSFSCKRRADMVEHLKKCHDVQGKVQGRAIADKWKETTKKQAWSCGFCGYLVHTFGDRLKHIATHFERGQVLDEWDTTKVIEGLLLQPRMASAWKTQLDSPLGWESSKIIWERHVVKGLQHDLEIGPSDPKHAAALAKAAYNARQSNWHLLNDYKPLGFAPIDGAIGSSAIVPTSGYSSITEGAYEPSSEHDQFQFVAPADTLHHGVSALGGVPTATYDYGTFQASSSDDGSSLMQDPWLSDPFQKSSSAADQYTGLNVHQEQSSITSGMHIWPTPAVSSDDPGTDDMFA
ncbi:hypothetical protein HO133_003965 [Letharia lupina]|uniref:C2H2-type domain-containing protein n=1 Tax=Letharia lupina TaxID=560253 RepID=A0A8H6C9P1_9LECA|nr:uncharacterized protein HO133_003965 [Letharia lupina]KAF6219497.1 hypothetical protein HO133_003965 [Letharia lupina]